VTHWIRRNFDSHESWFGIRTHHKAGVTETPPESSPDSVGTQEDTASVTFGDERYEREPLVPKATSRLSKELSAHKMTRWAPQNGISVSDDDDETAEPRGECPSCYHRGIAGTLCPICEDTGFIHESRRNHRRGTNHRVQMAAPNSRERMITRLRRLMRVGKAGNELPEVGQGCLVLRGEERTDLGQECVITRQTASRVHVSFRTAEGRQATRVKHPASLILLEDGLHVVQDRRGFVWIKREANESESEAEDR
jgi:hypothetical protein